MNWKFAYFASNRLSGGLRNNTRLLSVNNYSVKGITFKDLYISVLNPRKNGGTKSARNH